MLIARDTVRFLWQLETRLVPVDVMLTTIELEESPKTPWGGPYDLLSERFEAARHARKKKRDPLRPKWIDTSIGPFQLLGETYRELGFSHLAVWHDTLKSGQPFPPGRDLDACGEILLREQMKAYDALMGRLIKKFKLPLAFRRYNGGGKPGSQAEEMATRYETKAQGFHRRVHQDLA